MRKIFFLGLGALAALLCFLPLAWVGPFLVPSTFTTDKTQYRGTLWSGGAFSLRDLDRVNFKLKPFKYLSGDLPLQVDMSAQGMRADGALSRNKMEGFDFSINVANLPLPDPRLKGLRGQIITRVEQAKWDGNAHCTMISGTARSDVLKQNEAVFQWTGPALRGPISCGENGSFVFNLTGEDDIQSIAAIVSISAEGRYQSDMRVVTKDQGAALILPLFGFEQKGESAEGSEFSLVEQGQWR